MSNSPLAPSGYGEQTALFAPRLRDMGHDVSIVANYGVQAGTLEWNGMPVFPATADWGNPRISTFVKHVDAEWTITLCDAWVLKPDRWADDLRMAVWAPIDHHPIPPAVLGVLQHSKIRPIAMSRFGEEWMRRFSLDPLYVPHGVDTTVFRPAPAHRSASRQALNIPDDAFLVGMVGANRGWSPHAPRKSFPQAFQAFARFAQRHKDAYMYVHTETGGGGPAINLEVLAAATGCPTDRLLFPPAEAFALGVMDNRFMAGVYSAMDVLLNPSMSEGFGVPIVEAQACGVPVITSNHSAMPELTGAGWLVEGDPWWDGAQESFALIPYIASIEEQLENAYEARDDQELRERAVEFAQTYDADRVADMYWKPVVDALERPREVPELPMSNRAQRRAAKRTRVVA